MVISTTDSIIRLCVALILGAIIGYERQAQNKAAGLRTHTLVCVGSCLCMIISINIAMDHFLLYGYRNADPERIAAQVFPASAFRRRHDTGKPERPATSAALRRRPGCGLSRLSDSS